MKQRILETLKGGWRWFGRKIRGVWEWIGDGENNKALSVIIQLLTLGIAVYFGTSGISKIADISVNLREIKADVVEAGKVRTNSIDYGGAWEVGLLE